jgi:hypothetical protein
MSFTIMIIIFTILAGIAGWLLANHCSVYALVPVTFFFLALAVAGCMVYGANLFGSALSALSGVTGLQFGYLLPLFVAQTRHRPGAMSPGSKRVHDDRPPQRRFGGHAPDARRFVPRSGNS